MQKIAKPFVKWAGGKGQLLDTIRPQYPRNCTRYCEPFVGGGAVLFNACNHLSLKEIMINDINFELVNTYIQVKENVIELIEQFQVLQSEYWQADGVMRSMIYYAKRQRYNSIISSQNKDLLELATLFIFLNKTCFNGLYRVNRKGHFNVPIGSYKQPLICDKENLLAVSKVLQNVAIRCGDYKECMSFVDDNTFVYIDPPYRPISKTAAFTAYNSNVFGDKEQKELQRFVDSITAKGAKVMVSNSDPQNEDESDTFFDDLYASYSINRINANRVINSKGNARTAISELLIANY